MSDNEHNATADISDDILGEAAIWHARLRETNHPSRKVRSGFNIWLLAHPLHRQAFVEMESLWGALEEPVANALAEQSRSPSQFSRPRARLWTGFAKAACLLVALLIGIGWEHDWVNDRQGNYATAVGEQAPVALDDGSRITLNTQSYVAVEYSNTERRVRLLEGEAWFDVVTDRTRPFIVETGQGTVKVTGTRFNVRLFEEGALVSLDEGGVQLRADDPEHSETVVLVPGQEAQLTEHGISTPHDFDRSEVLAWQRGQFVFYDTPLAEVVNTLNRYRPGRILITNGELNELKISGVFSTRDPETALEVITNTLPIEQTRLTEYVVLLR